MRSSPNFLKLFRRNLERNGNNQTYESKNPSKNIPKPLRDLRVSHRRSRIAREGAIEALAIRRWN